MPVLDALAQVPGLKVVNCNNELTCAYAAGGHLHHTVPKAPPTRLPLSQAQHSMACATTPKGTHFKCSRHAACCSFILCRWLWCAQRDTLGPSQTRWAAASRPSWLAPCLPSTGWLAHSQRSCQSCTLLVRMLLCSVHVLCVCAQNSLAVSRLASPFHCCVVVACAPDMLSCTRAVCVVNT